jgi:uncharacterized protein YjlB
VCASQSHCESLPTKVMAAAAQGAVSNKGVRVEYDADGYAYHHYHVDANGDDLFRLVIHVSYIR